MKRKSAAFLFITCTFIMVVTTGCGTKYTVKGQVVDAENGHPLEGAAIAINWYGKSLESYLAPYASGSYEIETAETLSDENGIFQIPKYASKRYYMGVYKKGYVCWADTGILLKKTEKGHLGSDIKFRKGFKPANGMIIKLEPFTEEYSRNRHAHFTHNVGSRCRVPYNGIFRNATKSETLLHRKLLRGK